jgi:sugar/nucleoside kinase (ribokinase family)
MQAGVVTSFAEDDAWLVDKLLSEGVYVDSSHSPLTTTFTNSYDSAGVRTQVLGAHATALSANDTPSPWLEEAAVLHLGPIAQEIAQDLSSYATSGILGITPQGWLRTWDSSGNVSHQPWPIPDVLSHLPSNAIIVMSQEDLDFDQLLIEEYSNAISHFVVTNGANPAYVFIGGVRSDVPAYPSQVVDPTGAGDVFAAALFVRYSETYDLLSAARFAHAAAALSITAPGMAAIPDRAAILALLSTPATSH